MKVIKLALLVSIIATGPAFAELPTKSAFFNTKPSELQFSSAVMVDVQEESLASKLSEGSVEERWLAAKDLWNGHSRKYAVRVVDFVMESTPEFPTMAAFKRSVEDSLKPETILWELREGDILWRLWLACLRPHETLVPELLFELSKEPINRPAVIFALGKSGDPRALQPLLLLLGNSDYRLPGDAAHALGYMEFPEVETKLIEALSSDNLWLKLNACSALGKVGSRRALLDLQQIANHEKYTGALSVQSNAVSAIEAIIKRNPVSGTVKETK